MSSFLYNKVWRFEDLSDLGGRPYLATQYMCIVK